MRYPELELKKKFLGGGVRRHRNKKKANRINPSPKIEKLSIHFESYRLVSIFKKISAYAIQIPTPNSQNLVKGR